MKIDFKSEPEEKKMNRKPKNKKEKENKINNQQ